MLKKHNDLIILSVIWIISIYSVITAITNSYILGIQNYLGYGLVTGVSVLRFFTVKRFKTILGVLLVIGSVNAIQYRFLLHVFL